MIDAVLRRLAREEVAPPSDVPEGVSIRRTRWIPAIGGRLSGMRGPAAAVTLGNTILVHPAVELTDRLVRHELVHVRQWRRQPLSFPIRYLWCHLRFGYRDNPFEVEARQAEHSDDHRRA